MSTSAIKTIVEHSRSIDRTPLTAPRVAPERSSKHAAQSRLRSPETACRTGGLASFEAKASREVSGQGQELGFLIRAPAPFTAIARDESFTPTQSPRTPPVANPLRHRYGEPCAAEPLFREPPRARPAPALSRDCLQGRLTHPLAKGNAIHCTQGAFHQWASLKGWAPPRCPPFPAWQTPWLRRLSNPACSPARQMLETAGTRPHR
jgi:hypothetical protein